MTARTFAPRRLLAVGLLVALAGCGGTKRQTPVGTWKFSAEELNPSDTITFDEQGGVEWKRPGGWPKEGTSPGFPVLMQPLFESGGRGHWEITKERKLRLFAKKPDGTEWSQPHDYRIEGDALFIGDLDFHRLKN